MCSLRLSLRTLRLCVEAHPSNSACSRSSVSHRVTLKFQLHLRPDMSYLSIRDLDLTGKCVFIRVDFNVPLQKSEQGVMEITSDKRIKASLPTIQYARSEERRVGKE